MVETRDDFAARLGKLGKKHKKMTNGYTTKVGRDGLLIVTPKRRRIIPGGAGIKLLVLVVLGLVAFKAFALATVGPITYNERLSELQNGTIIERAGAVAMSIDPVTAALADGVGPVLR